MVSSFGFCGCANIEFYRAIDPYQVIVDKLVIEINESKINKVGLDLDTVMQSINSDIRSFGESIDHWKTQFKDYPEILNAIDKGIKIETPPITKENPNTISVSIEFANWQMFGLFYGYSEVEDLEYKKVMEDVGPFIDNIINEKYEQEDFGLFLIKYSIVKNSGIVSKIETFEQNNINLYNKYRELTKNTYSLDDLKVTEYFAYPDDRIYNNADVSYSEGGMTFMIWDIGEKESGFQMEMYKLYPKAVTWYTIALIISAIFIIVITIVIYKKSKSNPVKKITRWEVEEDGK